MRDRPHLRIVDQATWEKTQRRLGELGQIYGMKPGQNRAAADPIIRSSIRSACSAVCYSAVCAGWCFWQQSGASRTYFGCPNHPKGSCTMASRVSAPKAEEAILGLVAGILGDWPGWLQQATDAMRIALTEYAGRIPGNTPSR